MLLRRMLLLWSILENMTEVENLILVKAKSMEVATVATDLVVSWQHCWCWYWCFQMHYRPQDILAVMMLTMMLMICIWSVSRCCFWCWYSCWWGFKLMHMTQYVQCTNFQTTNEVGNDNAEVDILDVENPCKTKEKLLVWRGVFWIDMCFSNKQISVSYFLDTRETLQKKR